MQSCGFFVSQNCAKWLLTAAHQLSAHPPRASLASHRRHLILAKDEDEGEDEDEDGDEDEDEDNLIDVMDDPAQVCLEVVGG